MQKAPVGAKAAPGFLQRIGGWFSGRNAARSAQELKEEVTGAQLLERKAANRVKRLPVLTDKEKESLRYLKLSQGIKKIEFKIQM
jgi:hypothetical protein